MATTNFEDWLDCAGLDGYEDIYSLYSSVHGATDMSRFKTELAKGSEERWIVSADDIEEQLLLASVEAKEAFLRVIEYTHCGDMTMEGWYYYHHAMEKDD